MVTSSPSKNNVRPAKGGFKPKARFGLKKKESVENGSLTNGFHSQVSSLSSHSVFF